MRPIARGALVLKLTVSNLLLASASALAQTPAPVAVPQPAAPSTPANAAPGASSAADEPEGFKIAVTMPDGTPVTFNTGIIPSPHIFIPDTDSIKSSVVLVSDADGWNDQEEEIANDLVDQDAVVIGIDLPSYLAEMEKTEDDCVYLVSDIEELNQEMQRAAKDSTLSLPIVAGVGDGASLALAILAQTPDNTIQATVAVDPVGGIALKKDLCTGAKRENRHGRAFYELEDRPLPDPATVIFTPDADKAGRDHVAALEGLQDGFDVSETDDDDAVSQLGLAIGDLIEKAGEVDPDAMGLPLTILDAKPTRDTMAIIFSGDGGWRDIDKDIGDIFQKDGLPTVGVDSLRYFWKKQDPKTVSADLAKIIERFRKRWGVKNVMLVGYSFGADILPATYNLLPQADKDPVKLMSLLAFAGSGNFEILVSGWLGVDSQGDTDSVKDASTIDPKLIQCVFGTEDDDNACGKLKGVESLGIQGGHHFDGDYESLARKMLDALDRRLKPQSASTAP